MTTKQLVKLVSTAAMLLILTLSVGLTSAHETDNPHTHDTVSDGARPVAFLVIPIIGEQFPFHWLWHFMSGETSGDHRLLKHELMHWHGIAHSHDSGLSAEESNLPASLPQYD